MNTSTRILAAFAVATIAGAVLGMLLISSNDSKSKKITGENVKETRSFIDRLLRHKVNRAGEDFKKRIDQNVEEYEQA